MNMDLQNAVLGMMSTVPDKAPKMRKDLQDILEANIAGMSIEGYNEMLAPVAHRWSALMADIYENIDGYNSDFESEYK